MDLDKADEEVGIISERTLPNDVAGEELPDGSFQGKDGMFVENCGHEVSKRGRCEGELWETG